MISVIHQPHFLPWLGYYNKLANCQIFIIQDNVQYRDDYYQNRTKTRDIKNNIIWLNIPVYHNLQTQIKDIYVCKTNWKSKILTTIYHSYHKSPYFNRYFKDIEKIILNCNDSLLQINSELLFYTFRILDFNISIKYASHYKKQHSSTEDILYLCNKTGTTELIFGEGGGLKYHGLNLFKSYGIKIHQQLFKDKMLEIAKTYSNECYNLSIIDYLFNVELDKVKEIIYNTWKI